MRLFIWEKHDCFFLARSCGTYMKHPTVTFALNKGIPTFYLTVEVCFCTSTNGLVSLFSVALSSHINICTQRYWVIFHVLESSDFPQKYFLFLQPHIFIIETRHLRMAGTGFEPMTLRLWALQATRLLYPASTDKYTTLRGTRVIISFALFDSRHFRTLRCTLCMQGAP
jgi:hypothetical protein